MDELQNIQNLIYVIRGQRVMLDFDLAEAYGMETSQLKRQIFTLCIHRIGSCNVK